MIVSVVLAVLTAAAVRSPQQEYDAYVAQFHNVKAICGTMLFVGDGEPNSNYVFRVAAGGRYHTYMGDRESHFDLVQNVTYYPKDNSYLVGRHGMPTFRVIFGPRFGPQLERPDKVESVKTETFRGDKVRVFFVDINSKVYYEVLVRISDQKPVALRSVGNSNGSYNLLVDFDTRQTFSESSWNWKPPESAKRRT